MNVLSPLTLFGRSASVFLSKHWYAIRNLNGLYFNLDSKLASPLVIGDKDSVLKYLNKLLNEDHSELLLVVKKGTENVFKVTPSK